MQVRHVLTIAASVATIAFTADAIKQNAKDAAIDQSMKSIRGLFR